MLGPVERRAYNPQKSLAISCQLNSQIIGALLHAQYLFPLQSNSLSSRVAAMWKHLDVLRTVAPVNVVSVFIHYVDECSVEQTNLRWALLQGTQADAT